MFEVDSQSTLVCKVYLNEVEEIDLCPILDGAADISCQEEETWETAPTEPVGGPIAPASIPSISQGPGYVRAKAIGIALMPGVCG